MTLTAAVLVALSAVVSPLPPQILLPDSPEKPLEIIAYHCANDLELAFGHIHTEQWGDGWHLIILNTRCQSI